MYRVCNVTKIVMITQLCTLLVCIFVTLGMEWISGDIGLHPMAAGALAVIALMAPYAMFKGD